MVVDSRLVLCMDNPRVSAAVFRGMDSVLEDISNPNIRSSGIGLGITAMLLDNLIEWYQ